MSRKDLPAGVAALVAEVKEQIDLLDLALKRADAYSENTLIGLRDSLIAPLQRVEHMLEEQDRRLILAEKVRAESEGKKVVRRRHREREKSVEAKVKVEEVDIPVGDVRVEG